MQRFSELAMVSDYVGEIWSRSLAICNKGLHEIRVASLYLINAPSFNSHVSK